MVVGTDADEQLMKFCEFFGTKDLYQFIKEKEIEVSEETMQLIYKHIETKPMYEQMLSPGNIKYFDTKAIDLLNKMLNMHPVG